MSAVKRSSGCGGGIAIQMAEHKVTLAKIALKARCHQNDAWTTAKQLRNFFFFFFLLRIILATLKEKKIEDHFAIGKSERRQLKKQKMILRSCLPFRIESENDRVNKTKN